MNRISMKIAMMVLGALTMVGCGNSAPSNSTARDAVVYLASAAQAQNKKAFIMAFSPELRKEIKEQKSWESSLHDRFFGKMADLKIAQNQVDDNTVKILASWRTGKTIYSFPGMVFTVKKIDGNWLISGMEKASPMDYGRAEGKEEQINITPLK